MRRILILVAGLSALAALPLAHGQSQAVYTWKDANGVTHYADRPPTDRAYATKAMAASPSMPGTGRIDPRCMAARTNIARLKSDARDLGPDADGDGKPDSVLDPAQRASRLQAAESAEREYCRGATAP